MNSIKKEKDEIRKDFLEKRYALGEEERKRRSDAICSLAASLVSFRHADTILLYAPIKAEIDVVPLFEEAIKRGKKVAFPRCDCENRTMTYHYVSSIDEMKPCAYGILEPDESAPVYDPENSSDVAVCYIPGLAFDIYGYRLGYGKGYYDKFMHSFRGCTIGLIYSEFIVPSLPRGKFDRHADIMLTEKGIKAIKPERK